MAVAIPAAAGLVTKAPNIAKDPCTYRAIAIRSWTLAAKKRQRNPVFTLHFTNKGRWRTRLGKRRFPRSSVARDVSVFTKRKWSNCHNTFNSSHLFRLILNAISLCGSARAHVYIAIFGCDKLYFHMCPTSNGVYITYDSAHPFLLCHGVRFVANRSQTVAVVSPQPSVRASLLPRTAVQPPVSAPASSSHIFVLPVQFAAIAPLASSPTP